MGWYDAVLADELGVRVANAPPPTTRAGGNTSTAWRPPPPDQLDPDVDPDTCLVRGTIIPDPACLARRVAPIAPKPPILVPTGPGLGTLVLAGVALWWLIRRR